MSRKIKMFGQSGRSVEEVFGDFVLAEIRFPFHSGDSQEANPVLVGVGPTTIPAGLGNQADGVGGAEPLTRGHYKRVFSGFHFNRVEFDPFKIQREMKCFCCQCNCRTRLL